MLESAESGYIFVTNSHVLSHVFMFSTKKYTLCLSNLGCVFFKTTLKTKVVPAFSCTYLACGLNILI